MNRIHIIRSGLCSTVQDLGRTGFRHIGVPLGGALDAVAHGLANRLVGNPFDAATIEMTLTGDEFEFAEDTLIAITGADMTPTLHDSRDSSQPVAQHCPVVIAAGSRIRFHGARRGCRCYLAAAGGVDVPVVMGSRSTALRAAFGGHCGRILTAGDDLAIGTPSETGRQTFEWQSARRSGIGRPSHPNWFVRPIDLPNPDTATLRILAGTHSSWLSPAGLERLQHSAFRISSQSDRMGYRLIDQRLELEHREELLSEGVIPGTIQLPPNGNPILLMADCAPTGGYPRIGHVISADLGIAAQLRPGQLVRFAMVKLDQAQDLFRQQRLALKKAMIMADLMTHLYTAAYANAVKDLS